MKAVAHGLLARLRPLSGLVLSGAVSPSNFTRIFCKSSAHGLPRLRQRNGLFPITIIECGGWRPSAFLVIWLALNGLVPNGQAYFDGASKVHDGLHLSRLLRLSWALQNQRCARRQGLLMAPHQNLSSRCLFPLTARWF
jgi:hypothetical protein